MTEQASWFVIVFTAINIVACVWLMWWTARTRPESHGAGAASADAEPDTTGHVWDGDLEEYNNPLPRWWLGLFIITILFGAVYLAIYPGLGNFAGLKNWSQVEQHDRQVAAARDKLEARFASMRDIPLGQLAGDPAAMATARNLFAANCSTCHGSDARGAKGFPNLTDADWLWGSEPDAIYASIAEGRRGIMPPLGAALGPDGLNEVASYVVALSGGTAPADWVTAGEQRFQMLCAACHGADARGNPLLGAPNLTDSIWLHGRDFESVRTTIAEGRDSLMPPHLDLLGEAKVRLLAAYVMSLAPRDQPLHADPQEAEAVSATIEHSAPSLPSPAEAGEGKNETAG